MASGDLLSKFDELTNRFRQEIIEKERLIVKTEVEAYNIFIEEGIKAIGVPIRVEQQDIIHLNVAGQKMSSTRETLCQVESSMLASMFSGRWEASRIRDKDGLIFFDYNSDNFALILDYLRAKKIATAENPAQLPDVPQNQVRNYNILVEYLGLSDELVIKPETTPKEYFGQSNGKITIIEGTTAVHSPNNGHGYVLGHNLYKGGVVQWKLKLESFKHINGFMFVGIVKGDTSPSSNPSCLWLWSYGWGLGLGGYVYTDGKGSVEHSLKNLTRQGDTVTLTLDCSSSKLSILTAGQSFHQTLPSFKTWRLNIGLHGENDKISII